MAETEDKVLKWLDKELAIVEKKVKVHQEAVQRGLFNHFVTMIQWQSRFDAYMELKQVLEARLLIDNAPYPRASE